jgi:hypothetical protein
LEGKAVIPEVGNYLPKDLASCHRRNPSSARERFKGGREYLLLTYVCTFSVTGSLYSNLKLVQENSDIH